MKGGDNSRGQEFYYIGPCSVKIVNFISCITEIL